MEIAIGCDHAGWPLKKKIVSLLKSLGLAVVDVGCDSADSVDYPDYAFQVTSAITEGRAGRGILVCGTGIGMSIAANRCRQIRAALCYDLNTARMSREHNDANVLCLGGRVIDHSLALEMVELWLQTAFAGERHQRRIDRMS